MGQKKRTRRRGPQRRAMSQLSFGGENHLRCTRAARAALVARRPRARRALAQHGAATEEKTRDEDNDRRRDERRGRGEDNRGAICRG